MFQVVIQLGAIIAVVILFWKQIWPVKKEKEKLTLDKNKVSLSLLEPGKVR